METENFFEFVTFFGSLEFIFPASVFIVIIFLMFYLLSENKNFFTKFLIPFLASVIFVTIIVYFAKIFFGREGPPDRILYETDFSFPSGHTAGAFIFFSSIYYLLSKKIKSVNKKNIFLLFVSAIIILVGISRVVLGVHFVSDIFGGIFFGLIGLGLNVFVYNLLNKK